MDKREKILRDVTALADIVVFGTLADTYRTCGNPHCRCHHGGDKHGPFLQLTYRGASGKTEGHYVLKAAHEEIRAGVAAWHSVQEKLRELAELNKEDILERARKEK